MKIDELRSSGNILLETLSGSHLYGLNHKDSDIDIRGIFMLPEESFFGLDYVEQISDDTNDTIFYELKRFVELAMKNNPNILEILAADGDNIISKHPILNILTPELFLSKLCKETFCGYALNQIKKSHSLGKKMLNPQPKKRKSILEFCYLIDGYKSMPLVSFLKKKYGVKSTEQLFEQYLSKGGLSKVGNGDGLYAMFENLNNETPFRGIISAIDATAFRFSSIPKHVANNEKPLLFYFNHNGFKVHCKAHREYWEWVTNRNESRHLKNKEIAKSYDSKNMMHTFRLLHVGKEIAEHGKIFNDRRTIDAEFLFSIRNGKYEFQELMNMAESEITDIKTAYLDSNLPETPNINEIKNTFFKIQKGLYCP
jgi:predicted nucleotidyltransferase